MSEQKVCKYGVSQDESCENDCCYSCEYMRQDGKDILCKFDDWKEKEKVQFD
jgi:hypothetical protein